MVTRGNPHEGVSGDQATSTRTYSSLNQAQEFKRTNLPKGNHQNPVSGTGQ